MNKVQGFIILLFVCISSATAEVHQKIGSGFTYYQKDFQAGSQGVLVIEKIIPPRMINPNVAKFRFGVDKNNVDLNLAAMKQFVELVTAAQDRGETLSKDLGLVRAFNFGVYDYWNQYEIVTTTDASNHLGYALKITPSTKVLFKVVPTAVDPSNVRDLVFPFDYNLEEVKSLILLISSYQEGKANNEAFAANQANDSLLARTADFQKGKTTLEETKKLLGEPVQSMGMPENSIRIDYAEQHPGRGQSVSVVLIFDKTNRLKDKVIVKW